MKRLKTIFATATVVALFQGSALAAECRNEGWNFSVQAIPQHVVISQDLRWAPSWKNTWDQARKLFQQKQYDQALSQYQQLLEQKSNLDQARWEYISILMQQRLLHEAERELSLLLSQYPQRTEYRLAQAELALGKCEFTTAAELFDGLYRQQNHGRAYSNGKLSRILSGYIMALKGLNQHERLQPLSEELVFLLHSSVQVFP
jgi:tetratricopeptide (TPR) repeat protein